MRASDAVHYLILGIVCLRIFSIVTLALPIHGLQAQPHMAKTNQLILVNTFHPETIEKLENTYTTHKLYQIPEDDRLSYIQQLSGTCRAAATASWHCDPVVYQLGSLEIISCFGVGVDAIDFSVTKKRNIHVTNTPDVLNDAVADLALGLIIATTRNLVNADKFVRSGNWEKSQFPFGKSLAGKTLGILGMGRIGEEIAARAKSFKMRIIYHNRNRKQIDYEYCASMVELAQDSDILLCMLPGGDATRDLIDNSLFNALGPDGIFINVGRGSSVNESDLVSALESGCIAGAGLDVYQTEPLTNQKLTKLNNVVLLPHIGSATVETRRAMGNLVISNLAAFFSNKPLLTEVSS